MDSLASDCLKETAYTTYFSKLKLAKNDYHSYKHFIILMNILLHIYMYLFHDFSHV